MAELAAILNEACSDELQFRHQDTAATGIGAPERFQAEGSGYELVGTDQFEF